MCVCLCVFVSQVSSELCRAFAMCAQGRSCDVLKHYKSSPCPQLPVVTRDRQNAAAAANDDDDNSSENELQQSPVRCFSLCVLTFANFSFRKNCVCFDRSSFFAHFIGFVLSLFYDSMFRLLHLLYLFLFLS